MGLVGETIGRYTIIEKLGQGGMAVVYRAYDNRLERDVAIKVIRTDMFGSAMLDPLLKRFEREAKSLAKLNHPNIVSVHDYGDYRGAPYLVMQYLKGGTLKGYTGRPMPYQQASQLLEPVARALAYAHQEGVIHRDIKPANIMITSAGEPMLTDFGIAKILETDQTTQLTKTGVGIGTPEYMAPEQWEGHGYQQTDIYTLGVVYYELVTGRRPYIADTPVAVLLKQVNEPLPRPVKFVPGIPEQVEWVIFKALAKKPGDRYANMASFASALEDLSKGKIQAMTSTMTAIAPETVTTVVDPAGYQQTIKAVPRVAEQPYVEPPSPSRSAGRRGIIWAGILAGVLAICVLVSALSYAYWNNQQKEKASLEITKTAQHMMIEIAVQIELTETYAILLRPTETDIPVENDQLITAAAQTVAAQLTADLNTAVVGLLLTETSFAETQIADSVPTLTPTPLLTSTPTTARVYWDLSHGPRHGTDGSYEPNGVFSKLVSSVTSSGELQINSGSSSLSGVDLSSYQVVVVCATSAYSSSYSSSEASVLLRFVEDGGGLILLAEDSNFPNNINAVADAFGVDVALSTGLYDFSPGSSHEIYAGVGRIYFYNGGAVSMGSGQVEVLAQPFGAGRLVVIGDSNVFDDRWLSNQDNERFAINVFRWTGFRD